VVDQQPDFPVEDFIKGIAIGHPPGQFRKARVRQQVRPSKEFQKPLERWFAVPS
jgi:hypothetical protein